MKKAVIFFVLTMVVLSSCIAQNVNNERRVVGTWTDHEGETWVFGADGKLTCDGEEIKYVVTDTELATLEDDGTLAIFNISMSSDGKNLILSMLQDRGSMFSEAYWLIKR
jgi:uncharacterized protein with beta-barrel porin domain